jgi:hypothetical protein
MRTRVIHSLKILIVGTERIYLFFKNTVLLTTYRNVTASLSSADMHFRKIDSYIEIILKLARLFQQQGDDMWNSPVFPLPSKISFTQKYFCPTNISVLIADWCLIKTHYQSPFTVTLCASKYTLDLYTLRLYTVVRRRPYTSV